MRSCYILTVGLLCIFNLVNAIDKDEAKEMFRGLSQDCKQTEGATDGDVEMMVNENYPDTKEGKCMVACMQEQFGLVIDNKFSKEGFVGLASMAAGDDQEKMDAAKAVAEACENITHEDRCEQAILIGKCMEKEAKDRNLKME